MSRRQLSALAIVVFALLVAAYYGLGGKSAVNSGAALEIGTIESFQGQVESRPPKTLEFKTVANNQRLHSQEVVRADRASEAVLIFNTGTAVKLNEATKFVAEVDASRPEALIGTVLEGQVAVLHPGSAGKFRLFYQGRELPLAGAALATPSIVAPVEQGSSAEGLVITATAPDENASENVPANAQDKPDSAAAATAKDPASSSANPPSSEVLTNEDIVRELRSQTGFFQRCYLSFIHRARTANSTSPTSGTVTVSFKVQTNGRVSEANVVHSDFDDNILHRCVTEVVERTRFKPFKGETVPVLEFPIRLQ